jgi:sulfite reductase (ferredoxin)
MTNETKAQRVERLKREKCGLDVLDDLARYAASDEPIDADTIDRMKYYGLYTQKLHDENDATQYLMLRLKLVAGELNRDQLQTVINISADFGRGCADFTTRQNIQFHWIKCRNLAEIFTRLQQVGLTTRMGSGDCMRNIVTCPLSGVIADEVSDVTSVVQEVNRYFDSNREFINLPRKFKIAISGCACHCVRHEVQDLSFVALQKGDGQKGDGQKGDEVVFDVAVGGGLSGGRQIAKRLNVHCSEAQIVDIAKAVAGLFRDHGNRENRTRARTRHLLADWGVDRFRQALTERLGYALPNGAEPDLTSAEQRHHVGIFPARKAACSCIGGKTHGGRVGVEALRVILKLMIKHEVQSLRITPAQDFVLLDVPNAETEVLVAALAALDLPVDPSPFRLRSLACVGNEYCKFGISETKQFARKLLTHLEQSCADFNEPLSLGVSGCPHGCAHPHLADIGLVGCMVKDASDRRVAGYELHLGGKLHGTASRFAAKTGIKLAPDQVPAYLETLIKGYLDSAQHQGVGDYLNQRALD